MNRIQSKNYKIETYELNKTSLSCFDDNTYPKQKVWWTSSLLFEIITKNSHLNNNS